MYGFGGVGQVEVRFGQMSPWRDGQTNKRKDRATQPMDHGRLRLANIERKMKHTYYRAWEEQ